MVLEVAVDPLGCFLCGKTLFDLTNWQGGYLVSLFNVERGGGQKWLFFVQLLLNGCPFSKKMQTIGPIFVKIVDFKHFVKMHFLLRIGCGIIYNFLRN